MVRLRLRPAMNPKLCHHGPGGSNGTAVRVRGVLRCLTCLEPLADQTDRGSHADTVVTFRSSLGDYDQREP